MEMDGMNHDSHSSSSTHAMYTHMTFFWGKNSEILFSGWPGTRTGMYVLALIVVFLLSVLVEWLSVLCNSYNSASDSAVEDGGDSLAGGIWRTALHGVRMAFGYLLMLAVMSFNVGVLLVAVLGHVVGFWAFSSGSLVKRHRMPPPAGKTCGHPSSSPLGC